MQTISRRALLLAAAAPAQMQATSPDGEVTISFRLDGGRPAYQVTYAGAVVVQESRLGFDDEPATVAKVSRRKVKTSWTPLYGERRVIPDAYSETTVSLQNCDIVMRAYNEGVAFRYRFASERACNSELTQFRFPDGTFAWEEHGTEGEYARVPVGAIREKCEWPLTVELPGGAWACLTEAALDRFPRMLLSNAGGVLAADLAGPARAVETPWRVLVLGKRPGDLLERNYLVLNLNPPPEGDFSWVKPGKAIREVTLSTSGGKACVDFAVARGLQYIEYDAGWYGYEYDDASDARRVSLDPKRVGGIPNHGGLDLPAVIAYAKQNGIGVLLYVNRRALEKQLDEILPLYAQWGVSGVKFGFVNVGPQQWTTWLMEAVRKAACHRLVVDIHDGYRPTGFSRTFPNLLTQEGVRGNEHMPTSRHNTTLPFTRFIAGAADYTVCYYTDRIKTTHAHQLALAVVYYSPLEFLFWYDQPKDYRGEPEVEFFRHVPTVWDETRVLLGAPGEFAVVARRSGEEWFVGGITNESERDFEVPLKMLRSGRKFEATVYIDDPQGKVGIQRHLVDSTAVLRFQIPADGGFAVRIAPIPAGQ